MMAIKTVCGQCAMNCGIRAMPEDGRRLILEGDRIHPVNMGWLCPRGEALVTEAELEGRLLHPLLGGRRVGPDRAIRQAAQRLAEIVARHGPGSVALHVAGDLPTEDYYAANKLMKGFIGSSHIGQDWADNAGDAHRAAFGEDVMPASGEDVDRADLILVVGAGSLVHHPALHRRLENARTERGAQVILIDADPAASAFPADLHLMPRPDQLPRLLGGLLAHCHQGGMTDADFLTRHVHVPAGFWDGLLPGHDVWSVARATGVPIAQIRRFYDLFLSMPRTVTLCRPDQPGDEDAGRVAAAILDLHLATGRIGRSGAMPYLLPGAANAMGAREAGCGAAMLAGHHDFSHGARASVARFWSAPAPADHPGLSGRALDAAIADGRIRALLCLGAVPLAVRSMDGGASGRPFTIFAGHGLDATLADAMDLALPMAGPLERDGTLTGVDRLISRQRPCFALPGEAEPGWRIVTRIARSMGWHDAFHYERPADLYREHARLSVYCDDGRRLFNLRQHAPISNPAYDELTPWRWGGAPFSDGCFPTLDGRARLLPFFLGHSNDPNI